MVYKCLWGLRANQPTTQIRVRILSKFLLTLGFLAYINYFNWLPSLLLNRYGYSIAIFVLPISFILLVEYGAYSQKNSPFFKSNESLLQNLSQNFYLKHWSPYEPITLKADLFVWIIGLHCTALLLKLSIYIMFIFILGSILHVLVLIWKLLTKKFWGPAQPPVYYPSLMISGSQLFVSLIYFVVHWVQRVHYTVLLRVVSWKRGSLPGQIFIVYFILVGFVFMVSPVIIVYCAYNTLSAPYILYDTFRSTPNFYKNKHLFYTTLVSGLKRIVVKSSVILWEKLKTHRIYLTPDKKLFFNGKVTFSWADGITSKYLWVYANSTLHLGVQTQGTKNDENHISVFSTAYKKKYMGTLVGEDQHLNLNPQDYKVISFENRNSMLASTMVRSITGRILSGGYYEASELSQVVRCEIGHAMLHSKLKGVQLAGPLRSFQQRYNPQLELFKDTVSKEETLRYLKLFENSRNSWSLKEKAIFKQYCTLFGPRQGSMFFGITKNIDGFKDLFK